MLKRLIELSRSEAGKIAKRQTAGTMNYYEDDEHYACFETEELKTYKPRKSGRKSTKKVKGE